MIFFVGTYVKIFKKSRAGKATVSENYFNITQNTDSMLVYKYKKSWGKYTMEFIRKTIFAWMLIFSQKINNWGKFKIS